MVNTEFWYEEGGSQAERRSMSVRQSKRWWLPSPQVPSTRLSETERKRLIRRGRVVHQIFKAAKLINDIILLEIPVPTIIKDALLKAGKASLGEELYMVLTAESSSGEGAEELYMVLTAQEIVNTLYCIHLYCCKARSKPNTLTNMNHWNAIFVVNTLTNMLGL